MGVPSTARRTPSDDENTFIKYFDNADDMPVVVGAVVEFTALVSGSHVENGPLSSQEGSIKPTQAAPLVSQAVFASATLSKCCARASPQCAREASLHTAPAQVAANAHADVARGGE